MKNIPAQSVDPLKIMAGPVMAATVTLLLSACGTSAGLKSAQAQYRAGNVKGALSTIRSTAAKQKEDGKDAPVIRLEHASIALTAGEVKEAADAFRLADQAIEYRDQKPVVQLGREASAMLTNLNSMPYNTSPAERVMGASLMAVSFAANGELDKARSAIKLAKNRQKDNFERFGAQIERERSSMKQALESNPKLRIDLKPQKVDDTVRQLNDTASQFQPYANFTVPYAELLAGIVLGAGPNPDTGRSRESFAHAMAVNPSNAQLKKAASGSVSGVTHVIIEEGAAPSLGALRVDLPLVINGNIVMFSAAFPTLQPTASERSEASLKAGGQNVKAEPVCDFDRIVAAEYKRKMPATVARTVAASALKSVISYVGQEALKKNGKDDGAARLFALASGIYNVASAQADERIWATLPKTVRYAVIPTPSSGEVEVNGQKVKLAKDGSTKLVIARCVNGSVNAQSIGL
jgi:hypothetical protein